ncbi:PilZ domain-containing protein [Desulfococcaceae bacterium HSG8]|nr:PilZ domain-containing protein [Desulfococcaceae bacterium HSG8]
MENNVYITKQTTPMPVFYPIGLAMTEKKLFINNDNMAVCVCPKCKETKGFNVFGYESVNEPVRITHLCGCGHSQTLLLERRKFHRKKAELPGLCTFTKEKTKRTMTVKDLSRGGLKLELNEKTDVKIGNKIFVEFCLDDEDFTLIRKKGIIKNISKNYIGIEFYPGKPGNLYDKAIGVYTFE